MTAKKPAAKRSTAKPAAAAPLVHQNPDGTPIETPYTGNPLTGGKPAA